MANPKNQAKDVSEKPVGSDKVESPTKVGTEAINSPEYPQLGKKEYASFGPLNIEMEQNGLLPKFSVNLDQQKMADMLPPGAQDALQSMQDGANEAGKLVSGQLREGQETAINTGESLARGGQDMINQAGEAINQAVHRDWGKEIRKGLSKLASTADFALSPKDPRLEKPQEKMPHPELEVTQNLKDRPMNSFNCHFMVKSHVEGSPPKEDIVDSRNEQVTPNYLNAHGYKEVSGNEAKPGDIILVEDKGKDGKDHYYNHSAIVSGVDGKGHVTETLQKLHPDAPVATLNAQEFKNVYASDKDRYKIHIFRNPAKEGHLE